MQRLFFHNCQDKNSIDALALLDSDIKVIDVFGVDHNADIVKQWEIPKLPYLVDKELILNTPAPYYLPEIILGFSCRDYLGGITVDDNQIFDIEVNGIHYVISPLNGVLTLDLVPDGPSTLQIKIEGESYYPWEGEIEVIKNA